MYTALYKLCSEVKIANIIMHLFTYIVGEMFGSIAVLRKCIDS